MIKIKKGTRKRLIIAFIALLVIIVLSFSAMVAFADVANTVNLSVIYDRYDADATNAVINSSDPLDYSLVQFVSSSAISSFGLDRVLVDNIDPNLPQANNPNPAYIEPKNFTIHGEISLPIGTEYTISASKSGTNIVTKTGTSLGLTKSTDDLIVPIGDIPIAGSTAITVKIEAPSLGLTKSFIVTVAWRKINPSVTAQWAKTGFEVSKIDTVGIPKTHIDAPNSIPDEAQMDKLVKDYGQLYPAIASSSTHTLFGAWDIHATIGQPVTRQLDFDLTGYLSYDTTNALNTFTGWQSGTLATFDSLAATSISYTNMVFGKLTETCADGSGLSIAGYGGEKSIGFNSSANYEYTCTPPVIPGYDFVNGVITDSHGATTPFTASQKIIFNQTNLAFTAAYTYKISNVPAINQPPVPVIDLPATCTAGDSVRLSGSRSYDPDGTIKTYDWTLQGSITDMESKASGSVTFPSTGEFVIILDVTDNEGATSTTSVRIKVTPAPPQPHFDVSGNQKKSRKVTFDANSSLARGGTIDWSKTIWEIHAVTGGVNTDDDAKFCNKWQTDTTGKIVISGFFKKEGKYNVSLTITNTVGASASYSAQVTIAPDLPPVPVINTAQTVTRNPADGNLATFIVTNDSYSADGDNFFTACLKAFDSNNDGIYTDELLKYCTDGTTWIDTTYHADTAGIKALQDYIADQMYATPEKFSSPKQFIYKTDHVGHQQFILILVDYVDPSER